MGKRRQDREPNYHEVIRQSLLELYGFSDMLTGESIKDERQGSYHHIVKEEYGGDYTIENGAMLRKTTHSFIHSQLEIKDSSTYDLLMECLFYYKFCLDKCRENCPDEIYSDLVIQFETDVQPKVLKLVKDDINRRKRR